MKFNIKTKVFPRFVSYIPRTCSVHGEITDVAPSTLSRNNACSVFQSEDYRSPFHFLCSHKSSFFRSGVKNPLIYCFRPESSGFIPVTLRTYRMRMYVRSTRFTLSNRVKGRVIRKWHWFKWDLNPLLFISTVHIGRYSYVSSFPPNRSKSNGDEKKKNERQPLFL